MEKQMKNAEIVAVLNHFAELEKAEKDGAEPLKLSAATAWKRRLNRKALSGVSEEIEKALEEVRNIYRDDEHSEADPNNADVRNIKPQYRVEFAKKQKDILDQCTDMEIRMVKLSDLPETLTDLQMDTLEFMVEEE